MRKKESKIAYIDSSVLLRIVFNQAKKLSLKDFSKFYSSELIYTECLRVCHNRRLQGDLSDDDLTEIMILLLSLFKEIHFISMSPAILAKASQALPTILSTLDAIHFSSLELLAKNKKEKPILLTHDVQFSRAAKISGFEVEGC